MGAVQKLDVSVNIAQDFSDTQKAQARTNIGAAAASDKLDKDGLGDDVRVQFTQSPTRTNIVTGSKLSTLFGQIRKWFSDLKALAFKDKVGTSDVESGTYNIDISGNAATASEAARGSTLESKINSKQEAITWMTDAEALQLWTDAWDAAT